MSSTSYGLVYIAVLLIASLTEKPEMQQLVSAPVLGGETASGGGSTIERFIPLECFGKQGKQRGHVFRLKCFKKGMFPTLSTCQPQNQILHQILTTILTKWHNLGRGSSIQVEQPSPNARYAPMEISVLVTGPDSLCTSKQCLHTLS